MRYHTCPNCGSDLLGEPIPPEKQSGAGGDRYHRAIGVEIWGVYDGILFYACPDCHYTWHRWSQKTFPRLWADAEKHRFRYTAQQQLAESLYKKGGTP